MAEVDGRPQFGLELRDGVKSVNAWASNGIAWLEDQQQFYRERAVIEKEYSGKLSALAKKYFEKKNRRATGLSVGDSPTLTPGSLESSSLKTWTSQLNTLEARAAEHDRYSNELQNLVAEPLKTIALRFEELRKSHLEYAGKLEKERDASHGDLRKMKGRYDGACQEVENKRKKTESSFDLGKTKAQSAYHQQLADMRNIKNSYLISINVTNKLKEKYYFEYVPELLDSFQDLAETRIHQLNIFWSYANNLEASSLDRSTKLVSQLGSDILQNRPYLDSRMFVDHNVSQWQEPADMTFEPSPVWLDDGTMVIDESAQIYLRNLLGKSKNVSRELKPDAETKKRDIDNIRRLRQRVQEGKEKKDEVELVRSIFAMQEDLHKVERQRLTADVETLTIIAVAGDLSLGAQNHTFKAETFKIPTNCDLCGERIWGLSAKGFDCTACGYTCHRQCELKVPATCPGEQSKEERKKLKAERQAASKVVPVITNGGPPEHVAELPDLSRSNTMDTLSSGYAASGRKSTHSVREPIEKEEEKEERPLKTKPAVGARRNRVLAPPPTQYKSAAELPTTEMSPQSNAPLVASASPKGRMLYTFQASNDGEITALEDDEVIIMEADDGSGWTSIKHGQNAGLVPTSYLEMLPGPPPKPSLTIDRPLSYSSSTASLAGSNVSGAAHTSSTTSLAIAKKKGPAVAPKRGAKKLKYVEAMYDYEARSEAEFSMTEGERFVCVNRDTGDGWADVEKGGIIKSVPANYVQDA